MVGTLALTLAVGLSLTGKLAITTPLMAGLTLGLFVYILGGVSGGHFNPAVTFGAWVVKKIPTLEAAFYILSQLIGAGLGLLLIRDLITPVALPLGVTTPVAAMFGELLGAFFFTFGVASVVFKKVPHAMSGLVVGASLFLGISFAEPIANGILNPAVALGIGSFTWPYIVGPLVGGALGMLSFSKLILKDGE